MASTAWTSPSDRNFGSFRSLASSAICCALLDLGMMLIPFCRAQLRTTSAALREYFEASSVTTGDVRTGFGVFRCCLQQETHVREQTVIGHKVPTLQLTSPESNTKRTRSRFLYKSFSIHLLGEVDQHMLARHRAFEEEDRVLHCSSVLGQRQ